VEEGEAQAATPERPSALAWLASESAKDAAAKAARQQRIHRVTGSTLTKKPHADLSELMRQLKMYCM
jgi:hypothetical protein